MTDKDFDQYQEKEKKDSQEFGAPFPHGYEWAHPAASQYGYGYGYDPFPQAQVQQFPDQGQDVNVSDRRRVYPPYYPPYPIHYPYYPSYQPYSLQYPYPPYPPYRPYPPFPY
ncbi:hypothetical protein [Desmospora activa]|uniref:Uncharacterized protein n=1 Tax=Desmospora activa DSM 45169 TaxID=1121389 RepID=A0A2T4ZDA4_9BACL|nr:hypothetical protein [Desmospora activa]PTM59874.1 hypothetical protein C8J48_2511 [Desmospora activa DSM 45169]